MTGSQLHVLVVVGVVVCWGVVVLAWVAGAVYNASRGPRAARRELGWASAVVVVAPLVWVVLRVVPRSDWHALLIETPWVRVLGLALLVCGTVFALWARVALGTMWSSTPMVKDRHELRMDGPYGVTRHPIYTGLLGMLLGTALLVGLGHWLVIFAAALVFVEVRIHAEEGLLLAAFPEAYPRYRRRVPQLVPRPGFLRRSRSAAP